MQTVKDYVLAFSKHSKFNIYYYASGTAGNFDLSIFDAVVIHWSINFAYPHPLEYEITERLKNYSGLRQANGTAKYHCWLQGQKIRLYIWNPRA